MSALYGEGQSWADRQVWRDREMEGFPVGRLRPAEITNHPPVAIAADDEGPGAPAKTPTPGGCPPAGVDAHPTGAPAPESHPNKASVEDLAALILHNARAC